MAYCDREGSGVRTRLVIWESRKDSPVVTDTNDGNFGLLDYLNQLSNTGSVLVSAHSIHLVHDKYVMNFRVFYNFGSAYCFRKSPTMTIFRSSSKIFLDLMRAGQLSNLSLEMLFVPHVGSVHLHEFQPETLTGHVSTCRLSNT